jgi:hypothetical protein
MGTRSAALRRRALLGNHLRHRRCVPHLSNPKLVDEYAPEWVVPVVAHPLGHEVRVFGSYKGDGHGAIDKLAIDLRPEPGSLLRVDDLEVLSSGDLMVDGRVAESASVLSCPKTAAAEVLRDEIRGRRVSGVPASGDRCIWGRPTRAPSATSSQRGT